MADTFTISALDILLIVGILVAIVIVIATKQANADLDKQLEALRQQEDLFGSDPDLAVGRTLER